MKRLEIILGLLFVATLIMRLFLIPFHGVLTVLILTTLAIVYYPLGLALFNRIKLRKVFKKDSFKGISRWRIAGALGLGIGLAMICMGVLFKLQDWPGANVNLRMGLVITFIIWVVALIKYLKTKSDFYKLILIRIAIVGGFGLIIAITPALTLTKIQFRNHPDYIEAYKQHIENPEDEELREALDWEYHRAIMGDVDLEMNRNY